MPLKNVRYTRLETEESDNEEDESPPTHLNSEATNIKGSKWNHIDNLDEFFERVYEYQQKNGLAAIFVGDVLELIQFLFIVLFTAFLVTCLRWEHLSADKIKCTEEVNDTDECDIQFHDLFDLNRFQNVNPVVVLFLLMAFAFWIHRLFRTAVRLYRFWGIRNFYIEALHIAPADLRNTQWRDVVARLKKAQREHKMNIQKQELTELDVYHRILRFKNYMVAMVNKGVIQCKFVVPLYGEKVFFTQGLKFNYELILFWPSLKAPFKDSFYLREEYKSAAKKQLLVNNLRFRISVLAFLNLIFCPVIFIYQLLYSFFSYAELLKNQPGIFGRRRWSLYGRWYLRDFNELEHEFSLRLCRAYKPSVKYMDLFVDPILTLLAKNIAFICGSLLAVLLALTIIQENLLTANNVLTVITLLGLAITVCRIFIPHENQIHQPSVLMQRILGEIHYMPDQWKQEPHTLSVYKAFTHVFQFTVMYVLDELLSPLITPFILYFYLRHKASDIVDFLRNFTIDVSGVGDVCSFAEMNVRRHGNPEWLSDGVSRANQYEQAELGKTEISLMHFSRKNPDWQPSEDGANFMNQLRQSAESMHTSMSASYGHISGSGGGASVRPHPQNQTPHTSITYLQPHPQEASIVPSLHPSGYGYGPPSLSGPMAASSDAMQWSIWSTRPDHQYSVLPRQDGGVGGGEEAEPGGGVRGESLPGSTLDTLQIHQIHDFKKLSASSSGPAATSITVNPDPSRSISAPLNPSPLSAPTSTGTESSWTASFPMQFQSRSEDRVSVSGLEQRASELREPLLLAPPTDATPPAAATTTGAVATTGHAQMSASEIQDSFHSVDEFGGRSASSTGYRQHDGETQGMPEMTVVELHTD